MIKFMRARYSHREISLLLVMLNVGVFHSRDVILSAPVQEYRYRMFSLYLQSHHHGRGSLHIRV